MKALGQVQQFIRRVGGGVLQVCRRRREDPQDVVDGTANSGPPFRQRSAEVVPGDCVGNVGLGRDPLELDEPSLVRRHRPKRRDHAVDRAVLAVAFGQRRLAGRVVYEGNDGRRQSGAEGDEGDQLRQDLASRVFWV